jgi:DNA-binding GntR family transcriptional regulator
MEKEKTNKNKNSMAIYDTLRDMAISFKFTPGERINESELSATLGVSRTPLREAMQKLVSENLLRWERNKGFFCRPLEGKEIFDLYQFRRLIEAEVVRVICRNSSDEELQELKEFVESTKEYSDPDQGIEIDQEFHEKLAVMSGSNELLRALKKTDQRIFFIRWIDLVKHGPARMNKHSDIVDALIARDEELAVTTMENHVEQHLEQISDLIREGYGFIYTGNTPNIEKH